MVETDWLTLRVKKVGRQGGSEAGWVGGRKGVTGKGGKADRLLA